MPMGVLRELTEADIPAIIAPPLHNTTKDVYDLGRIKARHHLLAMTLAKGANAVQASWATGYDPATIRVLQGKPAFAELLAYYREQQAEAFSNFSEQAAAVGMEALSIIQERMEDEEQRDGIKFGELKDLAEMLFDRTVLPSKASKNQPPAQAPQPVTVIQFIDSPHAAEPQALPRPPQTVRIAHHEAVDVTPKD